MLRSLVLLLLLARIAASQTRAIVYTTAENTRFRLTPTDTLVFKPSEPTSEAKMYVFVDPRKTFQPFLGIGGALTDAAAETFAKATCSFMPRLPP
jgi:glucosylceramidase